MLVRIQPLESSKNPYLPVVKKESNKMQFSETLGQAKKYFGEKVRLETKFGKRQILDENNVVLGQGDSFRSALQNALLPKILEANQTRENAEREFNASLDEFAGFIQEKFAEEFAAWKKAKETHEPAGDPVQTPTT